MNELELKIDGTSVSIDHGPQKLKNSLIFSILASASPQENIDNELSRIKNDIFLIEGILLLQKDLSKAIQCIRSSKDMDEITKKLTTEFDISEEQACYFADTSLINITKIDFERLLENLNNYLLFLNKFKI